MMPGSCCSRGLFLLVLLSSSAVHQAAGKREKQTYIVVFDEPAVAQYTGGYTHMQLTWEDTTCTIQPIL